MESAHSQWQIHGDSGRGDDGGEDQLLSLLEQDRVWNCFALADLLPPMRESTRFVTARRPGNSPSALLLIVEHPGIQVISPFGDAAGVAAILARARLPERTLVQTTASHRPLLEAVYRPAPAWRPMLRMAVNARTFTPAPADARVERLTVEDSADVTELYRLFPEGHFRPELLAQGSYHGLRADGRLVAIAGTHVVVEQYGIAVGGGVFTHPDARGKGYAHSVTAAVVSHLLGRGCRDVVLNVFAENAPAIAVYHRLGFQTAHHMWTGQAERRQEAPL
ncbi:MAG TPA: GNAT family N-acetyltransferase [Ktedonobacterales bacterium]|nr:GNAT family N-acetyltransferase [Ktedonobacterales bacterium]